MSVSIKAPDENPSNVESILSDTIGLPGYTINPPGSRIEELLIELNELIKSGGDSDAYATNLSLTIDSSTYVMTAVLKNKDGESIGTPQIIDLPMESVVVSGSYNSQMKKVVLTLQNGSTIEFSVADLIDGLQAEITSTNKLNADLVDDSTSTNKFVTSEDKSAWNSKQNALVVGTNLDDEPTKDSTNPITSGGVFNTVGNLDAALDSLIMSLEPKTITANGTYDPADDGVDGYSEVTVNVSGGGSSSGTDVVFYDYDGSVVASYSAADFANLSAMPANPTHTGLTAQGWNWSLADAKAYVASYGKLNIGQMYITSDGKTRLYFTATKDNLSAELYLNLASGTELDVDWGDNSAHATWTSADSDNSKSHAYASAGRYVIAITVVTGEFTLSQAISNIYKVEIGNGAVGIGDNAFYYCNSLSSVTIPDSVTSIGDNAFHNCYALFSITIPDSVTSIGGNAFQECYALSSVTIPDSVESIGFGAFQECHALSSVTIPDSVESIIDTFKSCYVLSSVTIPDSVTSIGGNAFYDCWALSSIIIPDSVTSIGSDTFYNCWALSSVTIPDSVTSIGDGAFYNCYALSSVTIPDSVTYIGSGAFSSCYALSSVTIPNSVTDINEFIFGDCTALLSVTFESSTPPVLNGDLELPTTCIIRVPQGSLSDYTSAENYPDPSQYIYEEY